MSENAPGLAVFSAAAVLLITLGVWLGAASFRLDTFDCTNKCGGAHSIALNQKCYCEKTP
jgi:hypothetical protein